jgi:hypothetical protein
MNIKCPYTRPCESWGFASRAGCLESMRSPLNAPAPPLALGSLVRRPDKDQARPGLLPPGAYFPTLPTCSVPAAPPTQGGPMASSPAPGQRGLTSSGGEGRGLDASS